MSINERLNELAALAGFTVTDMATWCGCSKFTMRFWMVDSGTPKPRRVDALKASLDMLEKAIKRSKTALPVPAHISQYERKAYIEKVRADAHGRVPARHSSK